MIVKPVVFHLFGYDTTKDIKKVGDLDKVYDVICKALGERDIVVPPFPSEEEIISNQRIKDYENSI